MTAVVEAPAAPAGAPFPEQDRQWLYKVYGAAILSAVLAVFHASVLAMAIAAALVVLLGRRRAAAAGRGSAADSHRRWLRRTMLVPLLLYGGLLSLMVVEAVRIASSGGDHLLQAVAAHLILHSVVTLGSGLWLIVRLLIGGLRFVDGRPA
ncbi:hypothetical protein C882_2574 [Caenispirillum salinarum AK4]|uniref:Transmembrane protein n=1 Tax=Caenispirillum salinarum AK4 TaxID=1238182 RepID=K9H2L2_9PROT|nr:hypothetical protein [Caenispirillum salinarum]EKV32495.1 hypothetical protein C882_2574 [Caenispirillum salinarum AK4]